MARQETIEFPRPAPEPASYYRGVDTVSRVRSRNAVVFMRDSKANLQQTRLSNLSHHRHVLIFVIETAGAVSLEGRRLPLKAGEALLVLPYHFHHYMDLAAPSLRWLFITFDVEAGEETLEAPAHTILGPDEASFDLVRRIVELWNGNESPDGAAELLATLDHLLVRLAAEKFASGGRSPALPPAGAGTSWIARAESLVVRSIRESWTVRQIADKLNVSERHFRTRFKAETGVSIRRYRANIQLHRAIAAMKDSHLSIGRIAELSGFRSQAVFTRFIRRETGRSPTRCRRLHRSGALDEIFPR